MVWGFIFLSHRMVLSRTLIDSGGIPSEEYDRLKAKALG